MMQNFKFLAMAFAVLVFTSSVRGEESCATCLHAAGAMVDSIVNNEALMKSHAAIITKSMCYGETLKLQPDEQEPCKLLISVSWPSMARRLFNFGNDTSVCHHIEDCSDKDKENDVSTGVESTCDDCKSRVNNMAELVRTSNQANRILLEKCMIAAVCKGPGGHWGGGVVTNCAGYNKAFPLALVSLADALKEQSDAMCCAGKGVCC